MKKLVKKKNHFGWWGIFSILFEKNENNVSFWEKKNKEKDDFLIENHSKT